MLGPHSLEGRRRGGWKRAGQLAHERRTKPSLGEAILREAATLLRWRWWAEVEIRHGDGMPQWLDLLVLIPGAGLVALELDGSHGWHGTRTENMRGRNHTMAWYDERKRALMRGRRVPLVFLEAWQIDSVDVCRRCLEDVALAVGGLRQTRLWKEAA